MGVNVIGKARRQYATWQLRWRNSRIVNIWHGKFGTLAQGDEHGEDVRRRTRDRRGPIVLLAWRRFGDSVWRLVSRCNGRFKIEVIIQGGSKVCRYTRKNQIPYHRGSSSFSLSHDCLHAPFHIYCRRRSLHIADHCPIPLIPAFQYAFDP